jgi:enoyl-CoA hydratase
MSASLSVRVERRIAFVTIDNPPVNGLSHAVRLGLFDAFARIASDDALDGVVLHGGGRCFSAGGDIREFGTPSAAATPGLSKDVHPAIERCGKTVVAAIHGYALGGGLETAMACHYRIATPDAKLGLPESKLGVVPLSATQRLPRLIGLEAAIAMILTGHDVRADAAPRALLDAVVEAHDLLNVAADLATNDPPPLVRDTAFADDGASSISTARKAVADGLYPPFATHLLDAIESGVGVSFEEGLDRARAIYDAVVDSPESKAARAAFLASRKSASRK